MSKEKTTLKEWLKEKGYNQDWLVGAMRLCDLRMSSGLLSKCLNGQRDFTFDQCAAIYNITNGEIGLNNLRPDLYHKYANAECLQEMFYHQITE
jgi:DNA-binding transcriptional regulator YdaS (Cro superfamily)